MANPAVVPELLAAVLAHPDDDGARQVYADALIEQGNPRGEFIAVQCEIARRGNKETKATKDLWEQYRCLHARHSGKWAPSLRALGKRTAWEFERGFVQRLQLNGTPPIAAFRKVLATEPVTDLVVEYASVPWLRTALAVPGADRLRKLTVLFTEPPHATNLARVIWHALLPHLSHLRVGLFGDAATTELAEGKLPALRHLALGGGGHGVYLSAAGIGALAQSEVGARLEVLEVARTMITDEIVRLVTGMKSLEKFSASRGTFSRDHRAVLQARFGDDGFIVEDEAGFDYLINGVYKLSREGPRR